MRVEEARAILSVEADADAKAIRRAYLRAVKEHKPERDPEGFQRVREAFDLLGRMTPHALGTRDGGAPLDDDVARDGRDEPAAEGPPAAALPSDDDWARIDALEAELGMLPPADRIARLAAVLREDPGFGEAHLWYLEEAVEAGDADALEGYVREHGHREHGASARADLAYVAPERLTDDDLDLLLASSMMAVPPAVLIDRGRLADLRTYLAQRLALDLGGPVPFVHGHLDAVIELLARDEPDDAEAVFDELERGLAERAVGMRLDDFSKLRVSLVGEIVRAWEDLPEASEAGLLALARDPNSPEGPDRLVRMRGRDPSAARDAAIALCRAGPTTWSIVGRDLDVGEASADTRSTKGGPNVIFVALVLGGLSLIQVFANDACERRALPDPLPVPTSSTPARRSTAPRGDLYLEVLCHGSPPWTGCVAEAELRREMDAGRCVEAWQRFYDMSHHVDPGDTFHRALRGQRERQLRARCPGGS